MDDNFQSSLLREIELQQKKLQRKIILIAVANVLFIFGLGVLVGKFVL